MVNRVLNLSLFLLLIFLDSCDEKEPEVSTFTLTTNVTPNEGGKVTPSGGVFKEGETVSLTAVPNFGWVFQKWEGDLTGTSNPATIVINSNKTVKAIFELPIITHTLTVNVTPNAGGKVTPSGGTFKEGESVSLIAEPNPGWVFQKWEGDLSGDSNPVTFTMNSNKTINAVFAQSSPSAFIIKTFGGSGGDYAFSIVQTSDGGFVAAGHTFSNDGDFAGLNKGGTDILVIKINSSGAKEWVKTFGGSGGDLGISISNAPDGGFILTGYGDSNDGDFAGLNKGFDDILVMKINSTGEKQWIKTFGGTGDDRGFSIAQTQDAGYILTGTSTSNDGDFAGLNKGIDDIMVIKVNSTGEKQWIKTFGGSEKDYGRSIVSTTDGGYIITGHYRSGDGDFAGLSYASNDLYIIKLNSTGGKQWTKTFAGVGDDLGNSIFQTMDGGFVVTGRTGSNSFKNDDEELVIKGGVTDILVIKMNDLGETQWIKNFGGASNEDGSAIVQTTDGGFVLTGSTFSNDGDFAGLNKGNEDLYVCKLYSNGEKQWVKTFGGSLSERGYSIIQTVEGGLMVIATSNSSDGDFVGFNKGTNDIVFIKIY